MKQDTAAEILALIEEMKHKALTPQERIKLDSMAVGIISQDVRPMVMADNLKYWLDLAKHWPPATPATVLRAVADMPKSDLARAFNERRLAHDH